jgi:hypothetical protein
LSDAKEALAKLEKNAPPGADKAGNPLSAKIEALSKVPDSGDLKTAKEAFADIKKTIAQGAATFDGRRGQNWLP